METVNFGSNAVPCGRGKQPFGPETDAARRFNSGKLRVCRVGVDLTTLEDEGSLTLNIELFALLHRVHTYLDDVHYRSQKALQTSRLEAKELVAEFVLKQSELEPELRLVPHFAQFIIAAWALDDALNDGELSECGDWVGWAFSETIDQGHEVELHIGRMVDFWAAPSILSWSGFVPTLVVYLGGFFYYARRRTAMREVATELWGTASLLLTTVMAQPPERIDSPEVILGSHMLAWAAMEAPELAKSLTPQVERWVNNVQLPAKMRSIYNLTLATNAGRYSQEKAATWARRALDEFKNHLVGEQKIQMLATVFDASKDEEVEVILAEMQQRQATLRQALTPLAFAREAAFRVNVIQPYLVRCLAIARGDHAVRGLEYWHQAEYVSDKLDVQSVLLTMPFGEEGYLAVIGSKKHEIKRDSQALLERLSRETDFFLSTAQTVAYADNSKLKIPERPGVPNVYAQMDWISTLREAYCPEGTQLAEAPTCQLMLPSVGNPLQAVQLATWGTTWPIAASLSKPRPDRNVRAVALWSGGGSMTEAMEIEMLKQAFESRGSQVDVFEPDSCTAEDFLSVYEDPKYDIFWVASHGEFDHWSPSHVELQIARDRTSVSLEYMYQKAHESESRRLLVLNVCDGGRFEETGMIPRVGLAPGLAGPAQATISHLWPVMGFPSAAFGAYLAHYIAIGRPFFEAYKLALSSVRKPAADIAIELQEMYGARYELIDRLAVLEQDFSPIQFSGSAAFFQ